MDILKSIQQAEKQAAEIEKRSKEQADSLLSSVPEEVARERAEREAKLEKEIQALRARQEKAVAEQKTAVSAEEGARRENLTRTASANRPKAVDAFLRKLGL